MEISYRRFHVFAEQKVSSILVGNLKAARRLNAVHFARKRPEGRNAERLKHVLKAVRMSLATRSEKGRENGRTDRKSCGSHRCWVGDRHRCWRDGYLLSTGCDCKYQLSDAMCPISRAGSSGQWIMWKLPDGISQ